MNSGRAAGDGLDLPYQLLELHAHRHLRFRNWGMIVTSRNSVTNQKGVKVYEFTGKMLVSVRE
jgi:hypothetical protein